MDIEDIDSWAVMGRYLIVYREQPDHLIAGAGHFTFVSPCPLIFRWAFFCAESGRFNRAAFHRDFNRSVIEFYRRNL